MLNNLRIETLHKFSQPLPKPRSASSDGEGFSTAEITVSTKCDLATFTRLTHQLQMQAENGANHIRINPNLASFREPSRATKNLSIDFGCLNDLLRWLKIFDKDDHNRIKSKGTSRSKQDILRVLGTSCSIQVPVENESSKEPSTVGVDCFLPFQSCTASRMDQIRGLLVSEAGSPNQNQYTFFDGDVNQPDTLLYRCRKDFDEVEGRFMSPWRAKKLQWGVFSPSMASSSPTSNVDLFYSHTDDTLDNCFTLQWTPCQPLPKSLWSADATFTGMQVVGDITIFFSTFTFVGSSTMNEISTLQPRFL